MPLNIPTRTNVVQKLQGYVRTYLPALDPTVTGRRGFIGGMTKSVASGVHDWYVMLKRLLDYEIWPQTASFDFFSIGWWLDITELTRNAAAAAEGQIVFTGTAGTAVPAGTVLTLSGNSYTLDESVTIVDQTIYGTSEVASPSRGRFTTAEPHGLATGMTLTFVASSDTALDGAFEIEVMDTTTIEYDITGTAGNNPVTTTLSRFDGTYAIGEVTCTEIGTDGNIDAGGVMSITSPPAGVDASALVSVGGVADGSEIETLKSWRARVIEALGTDFGTFSEAEIKIVAKTVPGVTRVFVRKPTREVTEGYPLEGQVRIAFLRENDADPIPSPFEVEQVRAAIAPIIPAHTLTDDVEILAPTKYDLDIEFNSISPDTAGMRTAITANIRQFLTERATWGGTILLDDIKCAVSGSFDSETGQILASYSINLPSDDLALPVDAYPVLRSIVWRVA